MNALDRSAPARLETYQNLIGETWQPALSGKTHAMVEPSTGAVFARIAASGKADIDLAVKAARKAFDEGAWGRLAAFERGRLLMKLAQAVLDNGEELANRHRGQ